MKNRIVLILLIFSFLYGKVLPPQQDVNGESLYINEKVREYYILGNNSYVVSGPSIVSIYSRLAIPKDEKGKHPFSIASFLSDDPEVTHKFIKEVDFLVSSSLHPMHRYTKSAKIDITIPRGKFILSVENSSPIGNPVLTRVVEKRRKK